MCVFTRKKKQIKQTRQLAANLHSQSYITKRWSAKELNALQSPHYQNLMATIICTRVDGHYHTLWIGGIVILLSITPHLSLAVISIKR